MKLRLRSNSVRLRLTQTEVARMKDQGECEEVIKFPGGKRLEYSLQAFDGAAVEAALEDSTVIIRIPREEVLSWSTTSSTVGIYATVDAAGEPLLVSIEKDFQCLDAVPGEDQSDMFSNPATGILSC